MLETVLAWLQAHTAVLTLATIVLGVIGVPIKKRYDRRTDRDVLRTTLYREMADNLSQLLFLASPRDREPPYAFRSEEYLRKVNIHGLEFPRDAYNSAKQKIDLFRSLGDESGTIDDFYAFIARVHTPREGDERVNLFVDAFNWAIASIVNGKLNSHLIITLAPTYAIADLERVIENRTVLPHYG